MILVHTKNPAVNKLIGMVLMTYDSYVHNRDGTGYFNPKCGINKTIIPACLITNFGIVLDEKELDNGPLMCHVRAASTQNKDLLTEEHVHPFESQHFVLQHNGTLIFKDKTKEKEYENLKIIDSEIFLLELEKNYTGDVYADVKKTVDLFYGKFAFMIYHKPEKSFYVIRGKTATLFKQRIVINNEEGFVINTEIDTLEKGILLALNLLQLQGVSTELADKPEAVKGETAYKVEGINLLELGSVIQTEAPVATNFTWAGNPVTNIVGETAKTAKTYKPARPVNGTITELEKGKKDMVNNIISFLAVSGISLTDLDKIMYVALERPISNYNYSLDHEIYERILAGLTRRINNRIKEMWNVMVGYGGSERLYKKYSDPTKPLMLQFPYFLTESSMFKKIYDEVVTK